MSASAAGISPIGEAGIAPRPMNRAEAMQCAKAIRNHIDSARKLVLELYDRQGWKALGYDSWRECVVAEFDQSQAYLYRQLKAAQIEREISPRGEIGTIPEKQLRPLAAVPEGDRKAAWDLASESAPEGRVTARHVAEVVEQVAPKARPAAAPNPALEAGIEPADIAAQRRSGVIPEGVEVVVEESPATGPEDEDEPPDVMAEQSDAEFLAECPAREKLSGPCRKVFDRDALLFRTLTEARQRFHRTAKRELNANRKAGRTGTYHFYVSSFLAAKHPRHWLLCADCRGDGQVRLIGECPNCHGLGYKA